MICAKTPQVTFQFLIVLLHCSLPQCISLMALKSPQSHCHVTVRITYLINSLSTLKSPFFLTSCFVLYIIVLDFYDSFPPIKLKLDIGSPLIKPIDEFLLSCT